MVSFACGPLKWTMQGGSAECGQLLVFHARRERPVVDTAIEIAYGEPAAFQLFLQADLVTIPRVKPPRGFAQRPRAAA